MSDEIASVVKQLSEASNNTELTESLQLAQELQNSLDTSQTKPGDKQAQLVQDLNSSLLTLQLVALESVEQSDLVVSKESLHKVLDVAESFASKLDTLLSCSVQQVNEYYDVANEAKVEESEPDTKTQVRNTEETIETVTSQISPDQTNGEVINNGADGVPATEEQTSGLKEEDMNTATASRSEIIETLLIESAKTIMIPVVGDVLNEDVPTTPDVLAVEADKGPLEALIKDTTEEIQTLQIKEDVDLHIDSGKLMLILNVAQTIMKIIN